MLWGEFQVWSVKWEAGSSQGRRCPAPITHEMPMAEGRSRQTNPISGRAQRKITTAGETGYDRRGPLRRPEKQTQFGGRRPGAKANQEIGGPGDQFLDGVIPQHFTVVSCRPSSHCLSCETKPIRPEPKERQVLYGNRFTNDSGRSRPGRTKPISGGV